jgi:membrane protein implicated in regulation of membrane protease activity
MDAVFWLILLILLLGIETITVGLTTIWFAGGALVALILWGCGLNFWVQAFVFAIVSVILMIFTRPLAIKYINTNKLKTNYEGIIGKVVRVTKRVDNINGTGAAMVNGVEWTLRSTNDEIIIEEGTIVKVVDIKGVKLVVEEYIER